MTLWTVAAGTILIPLCFALGGKDTFRLPKTIAFGAETVLLLALALTAAISGVARLPRLHHRKRVIGLALAIASWAVLIAALSTNRTLSAFALLKIMAVLLVFLVTMSQVHSLSLSAISLAMVPAIPNAVLALCQRSGIWNPFRFEPTLDLHLQTTALIGNANDLADYLAVSALCAMAYALTRPRAVFAWITLGVCGAGLLATESLTAFVALFFSGMAMVVLNWGRRSAFFIMAAVPILAALLMAAPPLRERASNMMHWAKTGDLESLTSNRTWPIIVAWRMFEKHPFVGAGPGTFGWHYLDERHQFEEEHPEAYLRSTENYGEAHNDQLQLLAEGGLPAYALFLAAAVLLASGSFPRLTKTPSEEARFSRLLSLPLAIALFLLTLGSFPLQLAAVISVAIFATAACLAWSARARGEEPAA